MTWKFLNPNLQIPKRIPAFGTSIVIFFARAATQTRGALWPIRPCSFAQCIFVRGQSHAQLCQHRKGKEGMGKSRARSIPPFPPTLAVWSDPTIFGYFLNIRNRPKSKVRFWATYHTKSFKLKCLKNTFKGLNFAYIQLLFFLNRLLSVQIINFGRLFLTWATQILNFRSRCFPPISGTGAESLAFRAFCVVTTERTVLVLILSHNVFRIPRYLRNRVDLVKIYFKE